jgi:integrase
VQIKRSRYQHGSIRKVLRAKGFAWEYRYYVDEDGKRKLKAQTFDGRLYRTETDVRRAVDSQLHELNKTSGYSPALVVTFGFLLDRYIAEEIPSRKSTRDSYMSLIKNHLRPRWESILLADIKSSLIHTWFQSLKLSPISKGHIRALMHRLFDLAALWEYLSPEWRNPIEIVKVRNVSKRTKESVVLTPAQFKEVLAQLPEHVNAVAIASACLGLRVSEALGLKWNDIDWVKRTVTISRSAYRGAIDETKTASSNASLPLDPDLAAILKEWQTKVDPDSEWLFANPATGMPYHSPNLQQRWIRPAGESMGIQGLGFHSLRHSYRTWLDGAGVAPGITKDLMRHSAIATTFNVYGRAMSSEKREANSRVVRSLLLGETNEAAN